MHFRSMCFALGMLTPNAALAARFMALGSPVVRKSSRPSFALRFHLRMAGIKAAAGSMNRVVDETNSESTPWIAG